jgi:hypothetical protein
MRKLVLTIAAALAILSAGSLSDRASAMTLPAPAGVLNAVEDVNLGEQVAYVCRRVWTCGYYGCGWRRSCFWRPGGYYSRPYRYRHWRRY